MKGNNWIGNLLL